MTFGSLHTRISSWTGLAGIPQISFSCASIESVQGPLSAPGTRQCFQELVPQQMWRALLWYLVRTYSMQQYGKSLKANLWAGLFVSTRPKLNVNEPTIVHRCYNYSVCYMPVQYLTCTVVIKLVGLYSRTFLVQSWAILLTCTHSECVLGSTLPLTRIWGTRLLFFSVIVDLVWLAT